MSHWRICSSGINTTRGQRAVAALAGVLPKFMIPQSIEVVSEFPLTTNGKVDRKALATPIVEVKSLAPRGGACGWLELILTVWGRPTAD